MAKKHKQKTGSIVPFFQGPRGLKNDAEDIVLNGYNPLISGFAAPSTSAQPDGTLTGAAQYPARMVDADDGSSKVRPLGPLSSGLDWPAIVNRGSFVARAGKLKDLDEAAAISQTISPLMKKAIEEQRRILIDSVQQLKKGEV